ncbi:MAG: DMT family transporter [Candidatus Nanopelagicaceae bacterium]|nr:DMT family transporter [Candidatus Nanopelagicaceae bacterium]
MNKSTNNHVRLDALAALSGVLIALQARANGELSHRLDNAPQAALVSFSSGLVFVAIYALFSTQIKAGVKRLRAAVASGQIPLWRLFAGALGGSFVAIQTTVVPLIGVAVYSVASIAGQTATSLLVDRVGFTGGGPKLISRRRVGAALITVLAVLVSVADKIEAHSFSFLAVTFAVIAGALVGVQRALNGQINEYTDNSYATSLLNFINGTTFLLIFVLLLVMMGKIELQPLPSGPWWIYTGGVIGVVYIAATSLIVQHLGVLTFTLFSVGGQLFGSLLLDLYAPSEGVSVSWFLVSGIAMTYVGVVVGGVRQSRLARK